MELADQELIAEFVVESQEGLAHVENQMLAIEAGGADIDADLVNAVFRTMHSIKGAAGFFGLDRIGTLAHGLEELLNNLRNREIVPTSELVTTMLRAADFMKGLIDAVESSNDVDVTPYVCELQRLRPGATAEQHGSSLPDHHEQTNDQAERCPDSPPISEASSETSGLARERPDLGPSGPSSRSTRQEILVRLR
jgi:two-component system, chemotaxis family, sensor kinase CheA